MIMACGNTRKEPSAKRCTGVQVNCPLAWIARKCLGQEKRKGSDQANVATF